MTNNINFTCPRKEDAKFFRYWEIFVEDIQHRENIKKSHLIQLEVLCDLMLEYEALKEELKIYGRVYTSVGRNGEQVKLRPEVTQMNRVLAEIRAYSTMLGLRLVKDTASSSGGTDNEFEE